MDKLGITTIIIILLNAVFTFWGLQNQKIFNQYSFRTKAVLNNNEYIRLLSSAFLHVNWAHFGFNMITMYFFSSQLELTVGIMVFLLIYFGSLLGGNLFSLYLNRNKSNYAAVGASGAVSGVVFASIALFPDIGIGIFPIPFYIPGWAYGILFMAYSIYGIKSQNDNIGHDAHLGGALIGLIIAVAFFPNMLFTNYLPTLLVVIPSIVLILLVILKPELLEKNPFS